VAGEAFADLVRSWAQGTDGNSTWTLAIADVGAAG